MVMFAESGNVTGQRRAQSDTVPTVSKPATYITVGESRVQFTSLQVGLQVQGYMWSERVAIHR